MADRKVTTQYALRIVGADRPMNRWGYAEGEIYNSWDDANNMIAELEQEIRAWGIDAEIEVVYRERIVDVEYTPWSNN